MFPSIRLRVVSIIWSFNGLSAKEMSSRIVTVTERALTTTVDDIEHIESQSLRSIAVVKVFFYPQASVERGIAQITAVSQTQLRRERPSHQGARRWVERGVAVRDSLTRDAACRRGSSRTVAGLH